MTTSAKQNKALVRKVIEGFLNSADARMGDGLFACTYADNNPSNPGMGGLENMRRSVADWHSAFPDTVDELQALLAEGNLVGARWGTRDTRRGEFLSIPAAENRLEVTSNGVFSIEGGKVTESWDHFDALGLLRQLGTTFRPEGSR